MDGIGVPGAKNISANMTKIEVYLTPQALADGAAERLANLAEKAIGERGKFNLVLAGGNTPGMLYKRLAQAPYRDKVDWTKVAVFFGDERCVPPIHTDSNYRMASESLLAHVPVREEQIHRMRGEMAPALAAEAYEIELKTVFGGSTPVFDLVLLGLGEDGHTASLFPGSPAVEEREHWVATVEHTNPPLPLVTRITLTLPVLNAARNVVFLVSGAAKARILRCVLDYGKETYLLPAQRVQPARGGLVFLADEAARTQVS